MFWSGCWKGLDRLGKKKKSFENLKKWIHWSRLKWTDGSKIEFEQIYTKIKTIIEKIKKNILNKNWKLKQMFFPSVFKKKRRNEKDREKERKLNRWTG